MVKRRVLFPGSAALAVLMLQGVSGATAPRPGVDWPQFRGIRASGIDDRHPAPSAWDVAKNQLVRVEDADTRPRTRQPRCVGRHRYM